MGGTVLLWLDGNFNQGFRVTLDRLFISQVDGQPVYGGRIDGSLGPNPEIAQLYTQWQQRYRQLDSIYRRRLTIEPEEPEEPEDNATREECEQYAESLRTELNAWINSNANVFSRVRDRLVAELTTDPDSRVLIQTNDPQAQRIPWHLWNFWRNFRSVEVSLSNPYPRSQPHLTPCSRDGVRILAIFGNSEGIDVNQDRQYLEQLPGVDPSSLQFLLEPDRDEVFDRLEDTQGWDILFFAGHSSSENNGTTGRFYINRNDSPRTNNLRVEELKFALETAIENGLKLAIFNSCDGLGLAHQLANLQIPQIIVMREPVPDDVAQTFLRYFLESFSQGISIQRAVRTARQKLQRLEQKLPYATWLPVLYQHPTIEPINPFPSPPPQPVDPVKLILSKITQILSIVFSTNQSRTPLLSFGLAVILSLILVIYFGQKPPEERISSGEKSLFSPVTVEKQTDKEAIAKKQTGIEAIAKKDYDKAITSLQAARNAKLNDPETLIYLNNAEIRDREPYTIAVSVPIGTDDNSSLEILRGVAQAQDEINQGGGINGNYLKVMIADDDDDREIAKQVASVLVNNSKVLGVVGHASSDPTLAAGKIYDGKLVAISPTSTSVELTNFSPYIFRTVPSDFVAAKDLATYMISRMQKKTAAVFFNSNNSYSESLKTELTASVEFLKGRVLKEKFDLSSPGFNATNYVEEAIKQGAEVLMLATDIRVLKRTLEIVRVNHNHKRLSLLGGDDVYTPEILKNGKETVGMVVAVPWDLGSNRMSNFTRQSRELWGNRDVNWRTALSYDATKALIAALRHKPTRLGVQEYLSSGFKATGASGNIRFSASGDRRDATIQLVKVVPAPHLSTGYDFVPVEAVNPAASR